MYSSFHGFGGTLLQFVLICLPNMNYNVDNGPRNRQLHFGDVLDTLTPDLPLIIGQNHILGNFDHNTTYRYLTLY